LTYSKCHAETPSLFRWLQPIWNTSQYLKVGLFKTCLTKTICF
jgi:hypothetical protein